MNVKNKILLYKLKNEIINFIQSMSARPPKSIYYFLEDIEIIEVYEGYIEIYERYSSVGDFLSGVYKYDANGYKKLYKLGKKYYDLTKENKSI